MSFKLSNISLNEIEYESAEDWYENYGSHISTENAGDVCIQVINYDDFSAFTKNKIIKNLCNSCSLSSNEAEELFEIASNVFDAANTVEAYLEDAIEAFKNKNLDSLIEILEQSYNYEMQHGDASATRNLKNILLLEEEEEEEESKMSIKI